MTTADVKTALEMRLIEMEGLEMQHIKRSMFHAGFFTFRHHLSCFTPETHPRAPETVLHEERDQRAETLAVVCQAPGEGKARSFFMV